MAAITVRLYAAAAEAAGTREVTVPLERSSVKLEEIRDQLPNHLPEPRDAAKDAGSSTPSLLRVCAQSSYLVNGTRAKVRYAQVTDGDIVDVLPPFAGG